MKNRLLLVFSILGLAVLGAGLMQQSLSPHHKTGNMEINPDGNGLWKQVDSLAALGLSRSALELVNGIYGDALKKGDMPEFLKAALYRLRLSSEFEEDYIQKYIGETEKQLKQTPAPAKHILHSILADLYWQYYQQNRYRILGQTVLPGNTSDDIDTWDAAMFVKKVSAHYLASVGDGQMLRSVSLKRYDPVLLTAEGSKQFRPTLFDFLAHRAVDFFINEEASLTKPINPFSIMDPQFLSLPETFASVNIRTADTLSFHYRALLILQQAEQFHLGDPEPDALVDAVLKRLKFSREQMNLPGKDSLYLATLMQLENRFQGREAAADVIYQIAGYWYNQGQSAVPGKSSAGSLPGKNSAYITARTWCLKATAAYPGSDGAQNCLALLQDIEEPSLGFNLDQQVLPARPFPVLVSFRNLKTVWFRLLKPDYDKDAHIRNELGGERGLDKYLAMKPVKAWSVALPETSDYHSHSTEVIMPAMEPGYYVLLASGSESFSRGSTPLTVHDLWSTALSYISRRNDDGSGLIFVIDRSTGHPIPGVRAQSFSLEYDYHTRDYVRKNGEGYLTGPDGSFHIPPYSGRDYSTLSFDFSYQNDRLVAGNYYSRYRTNEPRKGEKFHTFFFTDRSIYRPGQPVFFKGIVVGNDEDKNRVVADNRSVVTLMDANGRKVTTVEVVTNEFGSFSGSFMLPASGAGGQFRLENGTGSAYFSVEEYKRPKFEVSFLPVTGSYRLNETVALQGKADSYTGVPVSDAQVSYRVVRSVHYPFYRYGWRMWPVTAAESEIANGSLVTMPDGTFNIAFTALSDPSGSVGPDPVYSFTVYADVTDLSGETRSSVTTVQVSSVALIIGIDIPSELNRNVVKPFRLTTANLNGKNTPARVTLEAFRLADDSRLTRPRRWNTPDLSLYAREDFIRQLPLDVYMDEDNRASGKEKSVFKRVFNTAEDSLVTIPGLVNWEPGRYLITLRAKDVFGKEVSTDREITVFAADSKRSPLKQAFWCSLITPDAKAGETIRLLAGTAARNGRMLFDVNLNGKNVRKEWIALSQEQKSLDFAIPADFSGDVALTVTMVWENRSHTYSAAVQVADTRNRLNIDFETFRSPLLPGGTEKWKLKLTAPDGKPVNAELLAGMYDASLDAFVPHNWYFQLMEPNTGYYSWENTQAFLTAAGFSQGYHRPDRVSGVPRNYDRLNWFGYEMSFGRYIGREMLKGGIALNEEAALPGAAMQMDERTATVTKEAGSDTGMKDKSPAAVPSIRRNLNETAFFYPHLTTDEQGGVNLEFTVPEALTRWNFMGLAHSKELRYGRFVKQVITRKELMVTPNLPRFFREGDQMVLKSKISNLTTNPLQGEARLQLFDALTLQPVDAAMKNLRPDQPFDIEPSGNTAVGWEIVLPEGISAVMVRITAQAGNHSDGEETMLPVLTNRMLVTETLPLPVNGKETRNFTFTRLMEQGNGSATLRNHRLTLEYTSNPAWYAVQALPYLSEQPGEHTDQAFNRFYANTLAAYIANSNPKIRNIFEIWKNSSPEALLSNLEKNPELKAVLIEETPWLLEARNESAQKQRIALMFDLNRMAAQRDAAIRKLQQSQSSNGGWPWFEGMPESRYITQLIVTGFGKLHYLKVIDLNRDEAQRRMVQQAVNYLGTRLVEDYERILKDFPDDTEKNHLNQDHIQTMYALSYLGNLVKTPAAADKALAYFSGQARKYWTSQGLYAQGMTGLWAARAGDKRTAGSILKSLRERSLKSDEMGVYWRDNRSGWFWYEAPVETQSLLIELFEESGDDPVMTDQMKTWLLKQKQTQSWPTARSTADAIYALLLRGGDWLQTDPGVRISMGGQTMDPSAQDSGYEAGTGYFKMSWSGDEVRPAMGQVSVSKTTEGPAWGSLYWQYFENLDKVTAHNSPLQISKQLFIKKNTDAGPVLEPITSGNPIAVGQQVVVRVELRTDRDLEYVHLKDMRAAGFEPVNTLSGYRWNGGLGYYENTRDAATNFYFSWLPRGTWVFEYQLTAVMQGDFSNGVTGVQCMYAPEFAAHSEGIRVTVR